jgi:hypothetical protein
MKTSHRPIRSTIFLGLICGLFFIPLNLALGHMFSASHAICGTFWLFFAIYSFLLTLWSRGALLDCVFPLILLFTAIFLVDAINSFFIFALAVIGWIRSGICFKKPVGSGLLTELLLGFAVGILLTVFEPHSAFGWALGAWMFFLVQAMYFVLIQHTGVSQEYPITMDPFEQASRQAEAILDCKENISII